jgi:hypothetical protein
MDRVRSFQPDYDKHLGGAPRTTGVYSPKYDHENIDRLLDEFLRRVGFGVTVEGLDSLYIPFTYTFPAIAAGAEAGFSIPWANRSLVNHLRVEMSADTEMELYLLRQPHWTTSTLRNTHAAFYAFGVGNKFMREGGALLDYSDESGNTNLHVWMKNVGLSTTTPTLILNKREPQ